MVTPSSTSAAEVELLEAEVWARLHGQFATDAGEQLAAVKRSGRATILASRTIDAVAINRAIGFGFEQRLDEGQLSNIRTFYRQHAKSRWFVECSPDASIDIGALVGAGGVLGGSVVKLVGDLDHLANLPPPSFEVVEVGASDASRFMELVGSQLGVPERGRPGIVSTMGQPEWQFYFALSDRRPVAAAAMFAGRDGAWFGLAGTLPEYRNCGAQTSLLVRRIRDAKAAGCRWVSAETSPESAAPNPSLRNMRRLGMRELYHRPWYRFEEDGYRPSA